MPQGVITAIGKSRTGKPTVTIDGQIYSASKVDISNLVVGDKLEFESNSSVYNGATVWFLNAFKLTQAAVKYPLVSPSGSGGIAAPAPNSAPLAVPPAGLSEGERAFVSNMCAHAIDKGLITDQATLGMWAVWAKNAIREAAKPTFETEIP